MTTSTAETGSKKQARRGRFLVGLLIVVAAVYLFLLPKLRRMQAETERLRRLIAERQGQATQATEVEQTLAAARAAVAAAPNDAPANLRLAALLMRTGRPEEAAAFAEAAVRSTPNDMAAALVLADLYERLRRHEEALRVYRDILKRTPGDPTATNRLAWLYISYGWTSDARALLEPVVSAHPEDPHLKDALALVYLQTHEFQKCERLLLAVRREHPDEPELWRPLGDLYMKRALPARAVAVLRDALKRRPGDPGLTQDLAQALFESGDIAGAADAWRRGLAVDPSNVAAHYGLGMADRKMGKYAEAIQEFETVSMRAPGYARSQLMLGQLYLRIGQTEEGGRLLRAYKEQHGQTAEFARVSLLLSSKPNDPQSHFEMARVYQQQHNVPRMIVELNRTLELDPNHSPAKRLLEQVSGAKP